GRRAGAGFHVPHRRLRRPRAGNGAEADHARYQDAEGRRHRGAAPGESERGDAHRAGGGDDLVQRGARRGRELSPRRQQLHRQARSVRVLPRDGGQDRPVLGDHQPRAAMTAATIRILLTEDVVSDAELEVRELKRAGLRITHRITDTEQTFTEALRDFAPDVILSDFSMPTFDGMSALALARELRPETPFIFVSGTIGEEYAIRALKNGATDYVLKTNLVRLPAAVERALADARERRDRLRTEVELELARERLTTIFNSLPDTLWSLDARSRRFLYVSPAAKTVFGIEPEALI